MGTIERAHRYETRLTQATLAWFEIMTSLSNILSLTDSRIGSLQIQKADEAVTLQSSGEVVTKEAFAEIGKEKVVLNHVNIDIDDPDVWDRACIYWQLLLTAVRNQPHMAYRSMPSLKHQSLEEIDLHPFETRRSVRTVSSNYIRKRSYGWSWANGRRLEGYYLIPKALRLNHSPLSMDEDDVSFLDGVLEGALGALGDET
ncbi:hypothetical protein Tco_0178135 [Tanacetum coccineum]